MSENKRCRLMGAAGGGMRRSIPEYRTERSDGWGLGRVLRDSEMTIF